MRTFHSLALLMLSALAAMAQGRGATLDDGRALMKRGEWQAAASVFRALTEREPDNAQAWYGLGLALHSDGSFRTALVAHCKAAGFAETRANASYNAACANARMGATDEAFTWLQRALDAGFNGLALLQTDADLASLRGDPRFAALSPTATPVRFLEDARVLLSFDGESAGDQFGWMGRSAGDVDGDGTLDIVLSAPFRATDAGANAGKVYVYSGKTGVLLWSREGAPGDYLGIGIEGAGDVNGDGRPDVCAGAAQLGGGAGYAVVYSGPDGRELFTVRGETQGDLFGRKLAGAGDWNGDGCDDLVVGAPGSDSSWPDAGRAYLYSGRDGALLHRLDGEYPNDSFGSCVDGWASGKRKMLVIGAQNGGDDDHGMVYVYELRDGAPEVVFVIESAPEDANLGRMFLSVIGDVNGDGHPDVYASDWESNATGRGAGRVYVHSGRTGERLLALAGERPGDGFGIGTAEAGDVDRDGCDDLVIGAWQSAAGARSGGKVYLYSGKSGRLLRTWTCANEGETFGFDATGLGDVDGDGLIDFLLTSAYSPVKGPQTGRAFVIAGGRDGARDGRR